MCINHAAAQFFIVCAATASSATKIEIHPKCIQTQQRFNIFAKCNVLFRPPLPDIFIFDSTDQDQTRSCTILPLKSLSTHFKSLDLMHTGAARNMITMQPFFISYFSPPFVCLCFSLDWCSFSSPSIILSWISDILESKLY